MTIERKFNATDTVLKSVDGPRLALIGSRALMLTLFEGGDSYRIKGLELSQKLGRYCEYPTQLALLHSLRKKYPDDCQIYEEYGRLYDLIRKKGGYFDLCHTTAKDVDRLKWDLIDCTRSDKEIDFAEVFEISRRRRKLIAISSERIDTLVQEGDYYSAMDCAEDAIELIYTDPRRFKGIEFEAERQKQLDRAFGSTESIEWDNLMAQALLAQIRALKEQNDLIAGGIMDKVKGGLLAWNEDIDKDPGYHFRLLREHAKKLNLWRSPHKDEFVRLYRKAEIGASLKDLPIYI